MPKLPRDNRSLSQIFEQIAQMLELLGEDRFRVIANDRAARLIGDASEDMVAIAAGTGGRKKLMAIDGIGAKIADKIIEFAETGAVQEHQELLGRVPAGLLQVLEIPGLGPKTVRAMWQSKQVESLADLKRIIDDGSILEVPRMGAKTVQNIKEAMAFSEKAADRTPLGQAAPVAELIAERLRKLKKAGVHEVVAAGSLRRGKETVGDLDFLASASHPEELAKAFTSMPEVQKVLASGATKCSVRLDFNGVHLQADLRLVPQESFGAALLYFTGSKEHNVRLRERALKQSLTLNEYGLFPEDDDPAPPQQRGVKAVAGKTEESVYKALKLPWIPPEAREDRELEAIASEEGAHDLITFEDIKAELHAHTTASDGRLSIADLARCAKDRGFHTIAVTDHSQSSAIAGGLDPDRLRRHIDALREVNEATQGITILAGSEVDILADGALDYDDDLLAELDIVVASPHASLRQDPKTATARLLKAVRHPLVHILGHPTGRLINRREGFFPDIPAIAAAAAENGVALEINANWMRLDLRDTHVRAARSAPGGDGKGALIAINCDVHAEEDFDNLRYGVLTARRGGLAAEGCVNSWSARKLHAWLKSKR